MNAEQVVNLVVSILAGLATCIPLAYNLVKYVKKAAQEKNWNVLLSLVMKLMEQAEKKFEDGATRKDWVMAMVQTSAEFINYTIDIQVLSDLIDSLCNLTKKVNSDVAEAK